MIFEIVGWDMIFLMGSLVFPKIARRAAPIAAPYSPSMGRAIAAFKLVAIVFNQNRDRLPPAIANNWSGQGPAFSTPVGNRVMQMRPPEKQTLKGFLAIHTFNLLNTLIKYMTLIFYLLTLDR